MLKKLAFLIVILLLGALPAAAQSPCNGATDLSWLREPVPEAAATAGNSGDDLSWLSLFQPPQPAITTDLPASATTVLASTHRPVGPKDATCSEDCDALPDISCTGQVCSAVSRNCSLDSCVRGSVTCDGVTTYCSQACPPNCTVFECKQPCKRSGCVATCLDTCTCECDTICP